MAVALDGLYWIEVEGASEAELRRGMAAARAVLDNEGIADPRPMFDAIRKQEMLWNIAGELTEEEERLIRVWERADAAGHEACCGRWRQPPGTLSLSLASRRRDQHLIEDDDGGTRYDLRMPAHPELPLLEDA
jgi:hypothetical protein